MYRVLTSLIAILSGVAVPPYVLAQMAVVGSFNPAGLSDLVGSGFDASADSVWLYGEFAADLRGFTTTGQSAASVPRPGETANDADVEVVNEALMFGTTLVPAGSLLFVNGETDQAEVYAIDKNTGSVIATLATSFGMSHVVGGAYHPGRDSLFLVQDRVPSGTANDNIVAEVNPIDGSILNTFKVDDVLPGFTVNFGDIDISEMTGNLLIVSSDESAIAEFTPTGTLVRQQMLPAGVTGLSGLAIDDRYGQAWVTTSGGTVFRLCGVVDLPSLAGDFDQDGCYECADINALVAAIAAGTHQSSFDLTGDGLVNMLDQSLRDFIVEVVGLQFCALSATGRHL